MWPTPLMPSLCLAPGSDLRKCRSGSGKVDKTAGGNMDKERKGKEKRLKKKA